eukprot:PLAT7734.1.p1 GENE.PLAT7734.1~~PLAT7734.1.p1  ORF type:complete len:713 (-),score=264.20 PLAT7734.1:181-2319(-)
MAEGEMPSLPRPASAASAPIAAFSAARSSSERASPVSTASSGAKEAAGGDDLAHTDKTQRMWSSGSRLSDMGGLLERMRAGIVLRTRRRRFSTFEHCFTGKQAVDFLLRDEESDVATRLDGVVVGQELMEGGYISHVTRDHPFLDDELRFYQFTAAAGRSAGKHSSLVATLGEAVGLAGPADRRQLQGSVFRRTSSSFSTDDSRLLAHLRLVQGEEETDKAELMLRALVRPRRHAEPDALELYDLVVIGGGPAGMRTAIDCARLGGRVALIEADLLGGQVVRSAIPLHSFLASSKHAKMARKAAAFGVRVSGVEVDFDAVLARMHEVRSTVAHSFSWERLRSKDVHIFFGKGIFLDHETVMVNGQALCFRKAVIATGSSPAIPQVEGLSSVRHYTMTTIFQHLKRVPKSMAIFGGSSAGCELAQTFCRFGSTVYLIDAASAFLGGEAPEAVRIVEKAMKEDGVHMLLGTPVLRVEEMVSEDDVEEVFINILLADGRTLIVDTLVLATGRKPNVRRMGLELAGIRYDSLSGIAVNNQLQSSNSNVYAIGDVIDSVYSRHTAELMARLVATAITGGSKPKFGSNVLPHITYTDPQIARIGLTREDMLAKGIHFHSYSCPLRSVDRACLDGEEDGFVLIHCEEGSDTILGATAVGTNALETVHELTTAMQLQVGLGKLETVLHAYPSYGSSISLASDLYMGALRRRLYASAAFKS